MVWNWGLLNKIQPKVDDGVVEGLELQVTMQGDGGTDMSEVDIGKCRINSPPNWGLLCNSHQWTIGLKTKIYFCGPHEQTLSHAPFACCFFTARLWAFSLPPLVRLMVILSNAHPAIVYVLCPTYNCSYKKALNKLLTPGTKSQRKIT